VLGMDVEGVSEDEISRFATLTLTVVGSGVLVTIPVILIGASVVEVVAAAVVVSGTFVDVNVEEMVLLGLVDTSSLLVLVISELDSATMVVVDLTVDSDVDEGWLVLLLGIDVEDSLVLGTIVLELLDIMVDETLVLGIRVLAVLGATVAFDRCPPQAGTKSWLLHKSPVPS